MAPTCKKCGGSHFNFVACADAADAKVAADRGRVTPRYVTPLPAGFKEWKPSGIPTWGQTNFSKIERKA